MAASTGDQCTAGKGGVVAADLQIKWGARAHHRLAATKVEQQAKNKSKKAEERRLTGKFGAIGGLRQGGV